MRDLITRTLFFCLCARLLDARARHSSSNQLKIRKHHRPGLKAKQNALDANIICKNYPSMSPNQYQHCLLFPDVTAAAIYGIRHGIMECRYQFKKHRWDCSSVMRKNPLRSPFLRKGYKESAFAYSIMSAGVVDNVARLCSSGKLVSCTCDMTMRGKTKDFRWGGCSHNIHFGSYFSEKFLESEGNKDLHSRLAHHNNGAGRLAVMSNVRTNCKCHGLSGSCEIKTCWKASPTFHDVGRELLRKFYDATQVQVTNSNSANGVFEPIYKTSENKPYATDLVYLVKSPSFCEPDQKTFSRGTVGRTCNITSPGTDNCLSMCCGRGYNTVKVIKKKRCNCKFKYCCKVICQVCTSIEWVTTCK